MGLIVATSVSLLVSMDRCMVGGMSVHNPPPHASESTGSKMTMRTGIGIFVVISCLMFLYDRFVVPWVGDLFDLSEDIAMLFSSSIILNICFIVVLITLFRSRRRQSQSSSTSAKSITPPISG